VQGERNCDEDELAVSVKEVSSHVSWSAFKAVIYFILSPWRCCKQRVALPTKAVFPMYCHVARYIPLGQHNVSSSLLNQAGIRLLHRAISLS
jgi:hypothetical protein